MNNAAIGIAPAAEEVFAYGVADEASEPRRAHPHFLHTGRMINSQRPVEVESKTR
jgi:hypothetical protein